MTDALVTLAKRDLTSAIKPPERPFPGLRPFAVEESHLFFGRDGQVERLIEKLALNKFVAVVGTSGSGKSSLLQAGLLPALRGGAMTGLGSTWRVASMRPGADPIAALAGALMRAGMAGSRAVTDETSQLAIVEASLRLGSRGLVELAREGSLNENLLVMVDQFEELFRFAREARWRHTERFDNDAAAFVKLLLEATNSDDQARRAPSVFVVIAMRSDFLGDCAQFWGLPEAISDSQYLIPRLTRDQLREVITGPIALCGGEITDRLVNLLLNDIADHQDQLPILQHAMMRTWEAWRSAAHVHEATPRLMDLCCYEAIGGLENALSRHADEAFDTLPDTRHQYLAEKLFQCMTEKGEDNREIRRPSTLRELQDVAGATPAEVEIVIEAFRKPGRSFLMPPGGIALSDEVVIDISHESLIRGWTRLRDWTDKEARSAGVYLRLAQTAVLNRDGHAALWRDPDLQVALDWRAKTNPNQPWARRYHPEFELAMGFLDKSRDAHQAAIHAEATRYARELRRTRIFAIVLLLAFVVTSLLGYFAYESESRAKTNAAQAKKNEEEAKKNEREAARSAASAAMSAANASASAAEAKWNKEKAKQNEVKALRNEEKAKKNEEQAKKNARLAKEKELKAIENEELAKNNARLARSSADLAAENAARAIRNLSMLYQEKARYALSIAGTKDSAQDALEGWINSLAALTFAKESLPETAGILLQNELLPGNHASTYESRTKHPVEIATILESLDNIYVGKGIIYEHDKSISKELRDVTVFAAEPSGSEFVTGYENGKVELWRREGAQSGQWIQQAKMDKLEGVPGSVLFPNRSNSEQRLIVGDRDGNLRLLIAQGAEIRSVAKYACQVNPCAAITALAWMKESENLAVGYGDGLVRFFRLVNDDFHPLPGEISSGRTPPDVLAFWPGSQLILSGHSDGTVRVWDRAGKGLLASARLHNGAIKALRVDSVQSVLISLSKDGDRKRTSLRPSFFDQQWEMSKLLEPASRAEALQRLYRVSREKLGYDADRDEPTPGPNVTLAAVKYFGGDAIQHFTEGEYNQGKLLVRTKFPGAEFLSKSLQRQMTLISDQTPSAASAIFHKMDLRTGFAVDFEYRIWNRVQSNQYQIADGLVFMFYKDRTKYADSRKIPGGGALAFVPGSGYGVRFNVYLNPELDLRGADWKRIAKANSSRGIYTGAKWKRVCVEVSPDVAASACSSSGESFQGVRVFLDGALALSWEGVGDWRGDFGGIGFGAGTGEGMAEISVRDVDLRTLDGKSIPTNWENWERTGRFDSGNSPPQPPPQFTKDKLVLIPDGTPFAAAAVLLETSVPVPSDFTIDFEYSMKNYKSSAASATGKGIVFMFDKNIEPYRTDALPPGDEKGFINGSGYGIHFHVHHARTIELRNAEGKVLRQSTARFLPDPYSDGEWRKVRVEVSHREPNRVRVIYEGVEVIEWVGHLGSKDNDKSIGFGAATSGLYGDMAWAEHAIRNVVLRKARETGQLASSPLPTQ